jgi:hypothetical protein
MSRVTRRAPSHTRSGDKIATMPLRRRARIEAAIKAHEAALNELRQLIGPSPKKARRSAR